MLENLEEFLEEEDANTPGAPKPNLQANKDEIDELLEEANMMARSSQQNMFTGKDDDDSIQSSLLDEPVLPPQTT